MPILCALEMFVAGACPTDSDAGSSLSMASAPSRITPGPPRLGSLKNPRRPNDSQHMFSKRFHLLLQRLLAPAFPDARILSFIYNSKWLIDALIKTIEEVGEDMFEDIKKKRSRCVMHFFDTTNVLLAPPNNFHWI